MKIAYIYPEQLPSKKARAVSVINTSCELSKLIDTTLFYEKSGKNILDFYNLNCNLNLQPISRRFLIRSNKIFNYNLLNHLKNEKFDAIYVRHLKTAEYLIKKGFDIIFEYHEIFSVTNKNVKELEKFVVNNSKGFIFTNQTLKNEVENFFNVKKPSIIAYSGCGFEFEFINKNFSKIDEIYYIGSFQKWKGVEFLVKNMRFFPNLKLKVIGDGDKSEILEIVKKYNLKNIEFLGFKTHSEIKEILATSKITIIPNIPTQFSKFSTPIKLFEYLMSSNIVLSADLDTIKEIIKDKENGFLFKSGNSEDFVKKLNYILSLKEQELKKISKQAFLTGKNFTWENRAKKIVNFIKSMKKDSL